MLQVARRFGPEATLVTLIPDSGRGYLSKLYDDNWLMEHGFLEREAPAPTIEEVLAFKRRQEPDVPELVTVAVAPEGRRGGRPHAALRRSRRSPSCAATRSDSLADLVGSIRERGLFERVFRSPESLGEDVAAAMEPPLPAVEIDESVDTVFADLSARQSRRRRRPGAGSRSASSAAPTCSSTSPTAEPPATAPSVRLRLMAECLAPRACPPGTRGA